MKISVYFSRRNIGIGNLELLYLKKQSRQKNYCSLYVIFFLFFFCLVQFSFAQNVQWSTEFKRNPPYTCPEKGIGVDNSGNTYLIGATKPSTTLFYIAKFSPSGQEIWCDSVISGVMLDVLRTDSAGNSYLLGRFYQNANIGGIVLTDSANHMIGFYAKYNTNGICQWAYRLGERTYISAIYPLSSGQFYLGGNASTGALHLANDTIPANHSFIGKLDSSGSFICAKAIGTCNFRYLKIDAVGNFYISGGLYGTKIVGEGAGALYISSNSWTSAFIAKFDSSLNVQWAKVGKTYGVYDPVSGLDLDSAGNVYVAGRMGYYMDFDGNTVSTSGNNMYLVKYDPAGNYQWMKYSYILTSGTAINECHGLTVDKAGNSYVTGTIGGDTTSFDSYLVNEAGNPYLIKYDTYGNLVWGLNSEILPSGSDPDGTGRALCHDDFGNVFIAGNFDGGSKAFITKISELGIITEQKEIENNSSLNVYPNPTTSSFQINYSSPEKSKLQLNISNSFGEKIYSETVSQLLTEYKKDIDLSKHAKGVYFIEITCLPDRQVTNKKRSVKKVVLN